MYIVFATDFVGSGQVRVLPPPHHQLLLDLTFGIEDIHFLGFLPGWLGEGTSFVAFEFEGERSLRVKGVRERTSILGDWLLGQAPEVYFC